MDTFEYLLIGLPGSGLGGLALTLAYFFAAALAAVAAGFVYAAFCMLYPRLGMVLQVTSALLRGVPLLLLLFFFASLPGISVTVAGFLGLAAYSFSHVSEIFRGFLNAYPLALREQTCSMGVRPWRDWLELRAGWTCARALPALLTHWVSLLKDTGGLVILGIGEMTTVAKLLSETAFDFDRWALILLSAAVLYLTTTLILIAAVERLARGLKARKLTGKYSMVGQT